MDDPSRAMARIAAACTLERPERGGLVLSMTAELVSRRMFRRFRQGSGLAYDPNGWVDGDGGLHLDVEAPVEAAPSTLLDLSAIVTAPAEPWEVDEARLRLAARIAPELQGPATLPFVLMPAGAGMLAPQEIEAIVPKLLAVVPTDVDASLAGCAASMITVVQGPAARLDLNGFVRVEPQVVP